MVGEGQMTDANAEAPLAGLQDVTKVYRLRRMLGLGRARELRAVDRVSLSIPRGQSFGLVGESGCGKTTLGRILLGLVPATSGEVFVDGASVAGMVPEERRRLKRRMQIIFQNPYSSLNPSFNVRQILWEGYRQNPSAIEDRGRQRLAEVLEQVGLSAEYLDRYPHQLSGGQRQRVGIARALTVDPDLIVCDEPVSALDVSIQAQVLNLFISLQRQLGLTYLFISHDLHVIRYVCDHVAVMYLGAIVERAPAKEIFSQPLHPYTVGLLAASPQVGGGRIDKRPLLPGDLPDPTALPSGCRFRTRCPRAMEICSQQEPHLLHAVGDHWVACHLYPGTRV